MINIGDTVVCIDASMQAHTVEELRRDVPNWIKEGQQYTIRAFTDYDFVVAVYLEEIHNFPVYFRFLGRMIEPGFKIERFRKVEEATKYEEVKQENLITI